MLRNSYQAEYKVNDLKRGSALAAVDVIAGVSTREQQALVHDKSHAVNLQQQHLLKLQHYVTTAHSESRRHISIMYASSQHMLSQYNYNFNHNFNYLNNRRVTHMFIYSSPAIGGSSSQ
jgi:hypothetical protein